jgi:hypothetical protein
MKGKHTNGQALAVAASGMDAHLIRRRQAMDENPVREGMRVYSADGKYVGTVIGIGETHFQIERGTFIPHDYLADYVDVGSLARGEIVLNRRLDELEELHEPEYRGVYADAEPVNEPI